MQTYEERNLLRGFTVAIVIVAERMRHFLNLFGRLSGLQRQIWTLSFQLAFSDALTLFALLRELVAPFFCKNLMSSTRPPTHCVSSRSLLITFQKKEIRDAFVSTLFNQGPTWLKRATPNLACVIYVLPQQIASQGNQPFIFWDIIVVEIEIPPALTSSWYPPLLHLSGI